MKKKLLFVALLLCVTNLCFAMQTRVDRYRNYYVKLIWYNYSTRKPNNDNWAKIGYDDKIASWDSVTRYVYFLNPNFDGISRVEYTLYVGNYCLIVENRLKNGKWERDERKYYSYNEARSDFNYFSRAFENLFNHLDEVSKPSD